MKTSARNQFLGTVSSVVIGAVNAEVHILLAGGETLVAAITKESINTLAIKQGMKIIALIKASQIILITDFGGYTFSARNQLQGKISDLKIGTVTTEVNLALAGGEQLVVTVTNDSAENLGLSLGKTANALFKASAVILAVAG